MYNISLSSWDKSFIFHTETWVYLVILVLLLRQHQGCQANSAVILSNTSCWAYKHEPMLALSLHFSLSLSASPSDVLIKEQKKHPDSRSSQSFFCFKPWVSVRKGDISTHLSSPLAS